MSFERNPIVIKLSPSDGNVTDIKAVSFEEAFGEHSELFGRHHRTFWDRRKERVSKRKKRRADRRDRRKHHRTFWDKMADKKAAAAAAAEAEVAANQQQIDDINSNQSTQADTQQDGGAGADQAQTQQSTDASNTNQAQDGSDDSQGQDTGSGSDQQDMNPGYNQSDENQGGDTGSEQQTESDAMTDSGEESAQFSAETDSTGRVAKRSQSWELNYLQNQIENEISKYESIKAQLSRASIPQGRKVQLQRTLKNMHARISHLKSEIHKTRKMTGVHPTLKPKFSKNRIEIPAHSIEGDFTENEKKDLLAMDLIKSSAEGDLLPDDMSGLWALQGTYDKPEARTFSAFDGGKKINWTYVVAGVAVAALGIYLYKQHKKA